MLSSHVPANAIVMSPAGSVLLGSVKSYRKRVTAAFCSAVRSSAVRAVGLASLIPTGTCAPVFGSVVMARATGVLSAKALPPLGVTVTWEAA